MADGTDGRLIGQYTATREQMDEYAHGENEEEDILLGRQNARQISARETDYQKRRFARSLDDGGAPDESFKDVMQRRELEAEEDRVRKLIAEKEDPARIGGDEDDAVERRQPMLKDVGHDEQKNGDAQPAKKRKKRWDTEADTNGAIVEAAPVKKSKWDIEPTNGTTDTNGAVTRPKKKSRFDAAAPIASGKAANTEADGAGAQAPAQGMPVMAVGDAKYGPMSDELLDAMLPGESDGYTILTPPSGFEPSRAPTHGLPNGLAGGFMMQQSVDPKSMGMDLPGDLPGMGDLRMKQEDMKFFGKLLDGADENEMTVDELRERKIMRLLMRVKNGTPPMRKTALRQLTDNARSFGAGPLFSQILPLLMDKSLEDQERHLLVKVVDRIMYKLDDLVRPYTHKILVVIEPLLIDQDFFARIEGREIISNLAKAAGLAHMISTMRPDIDHPDEYVRNTTARAFAVVASALGIPALLPFLRAVCKSKKSWFARHTGVKIVQQIPILMGCAVLPHLRGLVDCIVPNLQDEQLKVRSISALAIAALAEASSPYGMESFDPVIQPLWQGARRQRGKTLAAFLKAVGFLIPLMPEERSNDFASQIMEILIREFQTSDDEMKKVVLKVLSQCANTYGVTASSLKENVLDDFFRSFWVRRMALDRRNYVQLIETTCDLAKKVGCEEIVSRIVNHLKDESEPFRKMTMETIDKVIALLSTADIDERLEERLIDGILVAFQEQSVEDPIILNGFGTIVNALDVRCKPFLLQIVTTILYRMSNKSPSVRQQAADLVSRIAITLYNCGEKGQLGTLSKAFYENLGEEYPEVLGSVLGALRAIAAVLGPNEMEPNMRDLLPRLTPILRNRHEKVQENAIDLVGRVADRGPEVVNAREWMRICFELLDMLKAHKKGIRRAANNTFGFIAKAIGPSDVLSALLNNLRVSERQSRVCTAVAIGIVAETCAPFTVLPGLMNEYRVPDLNVQNGVVKAISFMFEYIGEMGKDYVYAVVPLLEDALIDRDQVHRQTAASAVKHVALGVVGLGCEDAMLHLLNLVWPNIFETSPHVIDRVIEAIDALRVALGTGLVSNYLWAGLFHPARKVRTPYWRIWNEAYVMSADAFVPYYPDMELGNGEGLKRIAGEELMQFW